MRVAYIADHPHLIIVYSYEILLFSILKHYLNCHRI